MIVKILRDRRLFPAPKLLAHPKDDRAAIRHDHRIVDEDRIRLSLLRFVVIPDLDAGCPKEGDERVMFLSRGLEVRSCGVTPNLRLRRGERSVRLADEHDAQRIDHALTTEHRGHEVPRPGTDRTTLPLFHGGWARRLHRKSGAAHRQDSSRARGVSAAMALTMESRITLN